MSEDPKLHLAQVQQQINEWRMNKNPTSKIPEEIKNSITDLISKHNSSTICKTLGISGTQYKKLQKKKTNKNNYKNLNKIKQPFKKIILPAMNIYNATIENKNGCKLILQLASIVDLNILITNFIGGNKNVSIS
jgi:hypothetical protein